MKQRVALVGGALVGAVTLAILGWALAWPMVVVVIAAAIGLLGGAALGQALAWIRGTAGAVSRLESAQRSQAGAQASERQRVLKELAAIRSAQADLSRTVETSRAAGVASAKDQQQAIAALRTRTEELFKRQSTERRQVRGLVNQQIKQQGALITAFAQLQNLVPMSLPMPLPGAWAASEDYLLWLAGDVLERRPNLVVDLGSGQSSVWMAGAMRAAGYAGRVVAIDHDDSYAEATRQLARRQGVSEWLEVRVAPLREQHVAERTVTWYDTEALADLSGIGLLSVDGPPAADSPQARWPALPVLADRLEPHARIALDDMVREDEQQIVEDWLRRYPHFTLERMDFEKGAAVLSRT